GALPAPAQHLAAATLARFGIFVPEPPSVDPGSTGVSDHREPTHESSVDKGGDADAPASTPDSERDGVNSPQDPSHSSGHARSDREPSTDAPEASQGDDGEVTPGEASNDNSHAGAPPGQNKPADPPPNSRLDPPGHTKDHNPPSSTPPQAGGNS